MWFDRLRMTGIALIGAAGLLAAWKTVPWRQVDQDVVPAVGLTIPVEIVESGQAPQVREVRVAR